MSLSKQRDRERKRLSRLESKKIQPNIAGLEIKGNKIVGITKPIKTYMAGVEIDVPELDADGHSIPDYT